jgi:uncharacterized protein YjbJ (UPF0337 family)
VCLRTAELGLKIKLKYKAREARGRAEQTAGKATGNDRLRREGRAEELRRRLNQFAKKIKDTIKP